MTVYIFWLGKEHLGNIFRKAFSKAIDVDDENEPLPYRWAVLGLIFGLVVATVMCHAAGMSLWVSIGILLAFFAIVTVLSWLVSSAGLIFTEQMFLPSEYIETIAGTALIKPSGLTLLAFQGAITHDMLAVMMPNFMHSFKISDYSKLNRRSLTVALAIAVLVGLLVSYYFYFNVTYHYGGLNLEHYCYMSASHQFFRRAASAMQYPTGTNFKELLFMLGGIAFMGFLLFMRYRFIWWPLHPAGYLMHLTGQAEDDPWFTTNWLRVMLHNDSVYIQRAKPGGEGMAGEGNVPMTVGTPYKISIYMEIKTYKVYVDGKQIIEGKHELDFTTGYLIFAAWTADAAIEENHKLDDVFVYEGDYDPNPSFSVKTEGKLAKTWGSIKKQ